MSSKFRFDFLNHRFPILGTLLFTLISLGILSPVMAHPLAQDATGQTSTPVDEWATWVLTSGDQFRLDAPPNEAATAEEIDQLKSMAAQRDDAALQQIAYWNSGAPAYRWNQLAMNEVLAQAL